MESKNIKFKQFSDFFNLCKSNKFLFNPSLIEETFNSVDFYKEGNKIKIKKLNRGKFTEYCNGKVTTECINRGKNSPDPKIRKRATFAANSRKWKHLNGGIINLDNKRYTDFSYLFKLK